MASIQLYQYFVVDVDERTVSGGSLSRARSITLGDDEVSDQTYKIAASGIVKVFDKSENEALGDFNFLWMESDRDVLVQFTTDAGGANEAYDVKELAGSGTAGEMGPALVFGSDDTQLQDGTIDVLDGTADTIDEIWVKNQSSTEVARVRVVIGT
ncbi:hypothetical protein KKH23_05840 [Patescibacteria group bacterium]|nr:hypothetical protein [Patescibacteria group bacterium]